LRPLFSIRLVVFLVCLGSIQSQSAWTQSVEIDKQLGAQNAQMVEASMGLYPDARMTAYVEKVGNRLVSQLEDPQFQFRFHIADDPLPNAFALPGGYAILARTILWI